MVYSHFSFPFCGDVIINSLSSPFSLLTCHRTAKEEEGPATGHARRCQEIQRVQVLEQKRQDEALRENEPGQEMKEEELYSDFYLPRMQTAAPIIG